MTPPRQRVRRGGLLTEATDGVVRRPFRSALTALGTVLGVAAFVAVLGLTATANAQVSTIFNQRDATEVKVDIDSGGASPRMPRDAEGEVAGINGVDAVGVYAAAPLVTTSMLSSANRPNSSTQFGVTAVSAGYWEVVEPSLVAGRLLDQSVQGHAVAVIGQRVADQYGISGLENEPVIQLSDQPFRIIGIVAHAERDEGTATSITIPLDYARSHLRKVAPERMLITTELGAAEMVAAQAPTAIDPFDAGRYSASFTPHSRALQGDVSDSLRTLFLALAGVSLLGGAIGIANISLISVMERVREIGLRRALGALPRHILVQYLLEAAILGGLGGLMGGVLGELIIVGVAEAKEWTPTMEPGLIAASAPIGALIGVLAGGYPALRAARIEPVEAFRH